MLVFASFLHIIAVAGLDPIGTVDFLSYRTLLCRSFKDAIFIGGECWLSLKESDARQYMCEEKKSQVAGE